MIVVVVLAISIYRYMERLPIVINHPVNSLKNANRNEWGNCAIVVVVVVLYNAN